ncbi:hypothetical protein ACWGOK_20230 [Streptomyces eurythermus]
MRQKLFLIVTTVVFVAGLATGGVTVAAAGADALPGGLAATGSDTQHCC